MTNKKIFYKAYPLDRDLTRTWFVQYSIDGGKPQKRYGKLSSLLTLQDRLNEVDRIIEEIKAEYDDSHIPDIPLSEIQSNDISRALWSALERHCIGLRGKTKAGYESKVRIFLAWYRRKNFPTPNTFMGFDFIAHLDSKNTNPTTINNYRANLRTFFEYLVTFKVISENPFSATRKMREHRMSYRYFDEHMQRYIAQIIQVENPQLWLACKLQFYCLLRPDELRTIKIGDFNLKYPFSVRVKGEQSKTVKTQFVRIPDALIADLEFLHDWPNHFYVFGQKGTPGIAPRTMKYFPEQHQKILKRLNIDTKEYKYYSWKHTGAVMFYFKTRDLKALKEQGRWHSLDMVEEYLRKLGVMDISHITTEFPVIGAERGTIIR